MAATTTWDALVPHLTGFARIATADADGTPHVAKVATAVEGSTLWIATRSTSKKVANLRANPRIAITWDPGAEVYLNGTVEVVDAVAEKERLWGAGIFPFDLSGFFGSPDNPQHVMLRVTPTKAVAMLHGERGPEPHRWTA